MKTTRRTVLGGGIAVASSLAAPGLLRAQTAPPKSRTLRAVMHADLRVFDPIWTTANITSYHGGLIYDTLFALDEKLDPKPQMVGKHGVSDDKKTWTFELRDGLKFHDGSAVTAADCVASIRRWAVRDAAGQHMFKSVKDTPVKDDKTFQIVLSEPYGLMLDALGKVATSVCYIMRKKEAETDPAQQVRETIGSGPFVYNKDQSKPGVQYVYDKNANYVPRQEPVSGLSGAKIAKLDRVVMLNMPEEQTALGALQNDEIDFYEVPPQDLVDSQLAKDPNLTLQILNKTGHMGWMRLNHLYPPFNNVYARRAMLHLINQADVMKAIFGQTDRWKPCGSLFACGTTMENEENTGWLKEGQNIKKAAELFKQAGYDGKPVVILHATDHYFANPSALLTAQWLRQAGVNVDLQAMDWGSVLTRRAVKKAPTEGGWNIFTTTSTGHAFDNPVTLSGHATNGDKGWFGWPTDDVQEKLRDEWARAETTEQRKEVARRMQKNAWDFVPHIYMGHFFRVTAFRKSVKGVIGVPEVVPFWNIEKVA